MASPNSGSSRTPRSAAVSPARPGADWWRQAVVYQVYPRSFADASGDGIGDMRGITSRADYLASLGIDAVWISPFYPSALADGGYDVDHYRDVDPTLGSLEDFDEMVDALHSRGIRVVVDIVPNHSSNRHEWFQEALAAGPGSPARERYVFRDGTGPDGNEPPSDWESVFGGPAWEQVPDGQWYLHMFAPEQPDFNWDHPEVREDFLTTLRFWADRGVDGFRVDVAHSLVKDLTEPFKPTSELPGIPPDLGHPLWDQDGVHEVYASWREVMDEYDPPRTAVAEAWVHRSRLARYAHPTGLGQAFTFDLLEASWDPAEFRLVVSDVLDGHHESGSSSTWVLSNHDVVRHASRYGLPQGPRQTVGEAWLKTDGTDPVLDRDLGLRRARAGTMFLLALPGSAYLYQGEELGLHEVADLPHDVLQDPTWERSGHTVKGRDGCRVPIPWTTEPPSFGFGDAAPHLPQPDWFGPVSVACQDGVEDSTLSLYREALRLRHELQSEEELTWHSAPDAVVLDFERPGGWRCVTNMGGVPVELPAGEVLLTSGPLEDGLLPVDTTAWLR